MPGALPAIELGPDYGGVGSCNTLAALGEAVFLQHPGCLGRSGLRRTWSFNLTRLNKVD